MTNSLRRPSHRRDNQPSDRFLTVRNWLNSIFIIGAVIGILVYVFSNQSVGTYIILTSMVFKVAECSLRFIK